MDRHMRSLSSLPLFVCLKCRTSSLMRKTFIIITLYTLLLVKCGNCLSEHTSQHYGNGPLPLHLASHVPNDSIANGPIHESAINRLLQVFGMEQHSDVSRRLRHSSPPQFMLELYNSVADTNTGIAIAHPIRYNARTVRSFTDRDSAHHLHFNFNISGKILSHEHILEAELHLYKLKPRIRSSEKSRDPRHHLLEVRIYQVLSPKKLYSRDGNRLLDVRRMSTYSNGWDVFYVKEAVLDWIKDPKTNYGLLITAKSMLNEKIDDGLLRFAKHHQHHTNKQPILVVFSNNWQHQKTPLNVILEDHDYGYSEMTHERRLMVAQSNHNNTSERGEFSGYKRTVRSVINGKFDHGSHSRAYTIPSDVSSYSTIKSQRTATASACTRHELYVDFEKIGWSSWIISPKGYNAYYCKGECTFPLGQNQLPTNHATVQSIVHELNLSEDVGRPCCVPNKLYSISLLYFDEQENVILKQYDDMVAASCGCQ